MRGRDVGAGRPRPVPWQRGEIGDEDMAKRHLAASLTVLAAAALLLGGCGSGEANEEPTAAAAGPVTLLDQQRLTVLDQPMSFPKGKKRVPAVNARIITLEPGQETEQLIFRAPTYVYVLEGTYTVDYAAGIVKEFPAGMAYVEGINTSLIGQNKGDGPVRVMLVTVAGMKP